MMKSFSQPFPTIFTVRSTYRTRTPACPGTARGTGSSSGTGSRGRGSTAYARRRWVTRSFFFVLWAFVLCCSGLRPPYHGIPHFALVSTNRGRTGDVAAGSVHFSVLLSIILLLKLKRIIFSSGMFLSEFSAEHVEQNDLVAVPWSRRKLRFSKGWPTSRSFRQRSWIPLSSITRWNVPFQNTLFSKFPRHNRAVPSNVMKKG
jgi:hypothetical protein